jgi:hypothetical protein
VTGKDYLNFTEKNDYQNKNRVSEFQLTIFLFVSCMENVVNDQAGGDKMYYDVPE